jgi:hypothetical protein
MLRRQIAALLAATALVTFGLAAVGGAAAFSQTAAAVTVPGSARLSGVDLQTYDDPQLNPNFAQIAADKANMVNISVWWVVPSMDSDVIAPDYNGPTILDSKLVALIQAAQLAGLQVSLTPDFVVDSSNGIQWRGNYDPGKTTDGDQAFFAAYTRMVDHYASIAGEFQLPMYWIGSEMVDSEPYTADWQALIASVRQLYSGKLLYDVTWASLGGVRYYGSLDAMSVSAYWPLSKEADPSLDELLNGWKVGLTQLQHQAKVWQVPVYFGEAGYDYSTYAAAQPWSETYVSADPQLQYRCYEALDQTFRSQSWWGGVLWWAWDGGVYNMDGQPAESLIGVSSVAYPAPVQPATGASAIVGDNRTQHGSAATSTSQPRADAGANVTPPVSQVARSIRGVETAPTEAHLAAESGRSTTSLASGFPGTSNTGVPLVGEVRLSRSDSKLEMAGCAALLLLLADLFLAIRALRQPAFRRIRNQRLGSVREVSDATL